MATRFKSALSVVLASFAFAVSAQPLASPGNPIAPHIYAADPAPHVWPSDPETLWVYTSQDHPDANSHDSMTGYHAFSTTDLVNWTDHGQILSLDGVEWAAQQAWAVDAAFYKGKYYLVFCMKDRTSGVFMTALAISDRPEGPFRSLGKIKGTEWGQDPALYIDDDGSPYLYWGHDYLMYGAKLAPDLLSIVSETKIELTEQLKDVFEAPWMNKIGGRYYLSYAGVPDRVWPERMYVAEADKPLGPFHNGKMFMDTFPMAALTNHGGLVKFKGRWIFMYHSAWGSAGNSYARSLMAEVVTVPNGGGFPVLGPTANGVSGGERPSSRIWLEAENGKAAGGDLIAVDTVSGVKGYSGRGYVTGFPVKARNSAAFYSIRSSCANCVARVSPGQVKVLAQVAHDQQYSLKIRYGADEKSRFVVTVGSRIFKAPGGGDIYLPATGRAFEDFEVGAINLKAGDNIITFQTRDQKDIRLDAVELTPLYN